MFCVQDIEPFGEPKVELEQYPTGPEIASRMLFTVCKTDCDTFDAHLCQFLST